MAAMAGMAVVGVATLVAAPVRQLYDGGELNVLLQEWASSSWKELSREEQLAKIERIVYLEGDAEPEPGRESHPMDRTGEAKRARKEANAIARTRRTEELLRRAPVAPD